MKDFVYKSKYYITILLFLLLVFVLIKNSSLESIVSIDNRVSNFVSKYLVRDELNIFFKVVTNMGDVFFFVSVLLVCLLFKNKKIFSSMSINLIFAYLVSVVFKNIFRRARPLVNLIEKPLDYSFPSGHTLCSVAFYGFIIYLVNKYVNNKVFKYFICTLCVITIILIAFSRIYLSVHFFSDVVCGGILGLVCLLMMVNYVKIKEII